MSRTCKSTEIERLVVARGWVRELVAHGCRVSLGDDVKLVVMVTQSCDYSNIVELYGGLHNTCSTKTTGNYERCPCKELGDAMVWHHGGIMWCQSAQSPAPIKPFIQFSELLIALGSTSQISYASAAVHVP